MPYMKFVIDTLPEKGLRDKYIGGWRCAVNEEFARPSAPTPIAAMPALPWKPPRRSSPRVARRVFEVTAMSAGRY